MGKFNDCLIELRRTGGLDPQLELELRTHVGAFERSVMEPGDVGQMTGQMLAQERALVAALAIKKRQRSLIQRQAISDVMNFRRMESHPQGPGAGLLSLLTDIPGSLATPWTNVDRLAGTILVRAQGRMVGFLDEVTPRLLGFQQDQALLIDIGRELHGTATGNADAKGFAKQFTEAAEYLRQRFNDAGGDIAERSDWGSTQFHSVIKVGKAAKKDWIAFVEPLMDRAKMLNEAGAPLNDLEFTKVLSDSYDTISSDGLSKLAEGRPGHGVKLAQKHRDHRVLAFADGDGWVKYQKQFGEPDLWAGMMGHINTMAHEIALLEQFGPNPRASWERMKIKARQLGVHEATMTTVYDPVFRFVSGDTATTKWRWLASFSGGLRSYLISTKLGSAFLSALSDPAFNIMTSRFNGLSATRVLRRQAQFMLDQRGARKLATTLGIVNEGALMRAMATNRFIDSAYGSAFWQKAAEVTIRASGLQVWTDAGRQAFGIEWMAQLASLRGKDFNALPAQTRKSLQRYNFDGGDWEIMRQAKTFEQDGVHFMQIENVMDLDKMVDAKGATIRDVSVAERKAIADRFTGMLHTEMDYAVPMPNAGVRGVIAQGTQRGTVVGESIKMVALFKTFPGTVMWTHLARAAGLARAGDRGAYLSQLAALTAIGGAIAIQSKGISRGQTLREMDARFWMAALIQGGGAGLLGDFLYAGIAGTNRFGQKLSTTMSGPAVGMGDDIVDLIGGNIGKLGSRQDTNFGAELVKFASRYTPGSSIWYARLALERLFFDQLQLLADPGAHRSFQARERKARSTFGNDYYWRPGRRLPEAVER